MSKKILLTGGHAGTTALAVIEELEKDDNSLYWIGSRKAVEGQDSLTLESKILPTRNLKYYEISSGRLQKRFSKHSLLSLAKLPKGFLSAFGIVYKTKPDALVSFGGFIAFPVVLSAWILRVPILIHEQTIVAGLANKMSAPFASKIALARENSKKYFGSKKTVWTGNPIRSVIRNVKRVKKNNKRPLLYITGGSRGSNRINNFIFDNLDQISKHFDIIHQTGEKDIQRATEIKSENYKAKAFLSGKEVADIYSKVDLVISRAGANTVSELGFLNIPCILIPIPWSRYDEQNKNADMARKIGYAKVLQESEMKRANLLELLDLFRKEDFKIKINKQEYKKISKDIDAAKNIVSEVTAIIQ